MDAAGTNPGEGPSHSAVAAPDPTTILSQLTAVATALEQRVARQETMMMDLLQHLQIHPSQQPPPQTVNPSPPPASAVSASAGRSTPSPVKLPEVYHGDSSGCAGFLLQCDLFFSYHPDLQDGERIATVISLLGGKAREWATAVWSRGGNHLNDYSRFVVLFRAVFDHPPEGREAGERLLRLQQGSRTVAEYALDFRTVAAASGWNEPALISAFRQGLTTEITSELACRDDALALDALISLAIRLDNLLRERHGRAARSPLPPHTDEEPMQLEGSRLTAAERRRRRESGLCMYCGEGDHLLPRCPHVSSGRRDRGGRRSADLRVSATPPTYCTDQFEVPIQIRAGDLSFSIPALIDSGAAGNLASPTLARRLHLSLQPLPKPISIRAVDGRPISGGTVTHFIGPVELTLGDHQEQLTLYVLPHSRHLLVLGLPWLVSHEPTIHWRNRVVEINPSPGTSTPLFQMASTSVESPSSAADLNIPEVYRDLAAVFSKTRATQLPPHRPWDCAIDLLPGTSPPRSRIYPLTQAEQHAMETYVEEALRQKFIRPSSSPAAAGFFFVDKKDGGLRPCIDYRGLNNITVKYRYPLPLVPSALDQLKGAKFFTKLDLRSAYNLVRIREGDEWKTAFSTHAGHFEYRVMPYGLANAPSVFQAMINDVLRDMLGRFVIAYIDDILIFSRSSSDHVQHVRRVLERLLAHGLYVKAEKCEFHKSVVSFLGYVIGPDGVKMDEAKVAAVTSWPLPGSVKDLQRFLGFANFYRRFIRGFSMVASPLTAMLRGKPRSLVWTRAAELAFEDLKLRFTTAPVLRLPDPDLAFVVEVDASDSGVGAVLSQRSGVPPKLHPCAYFSRKLSPAERNYDVGDRELLALKLALEAWRHWLEGALHPFQVLTDHRNLEYLQTAKRMNPRQARWALFFTRFNFSISYRPGSRNTKADALSRRDSVTDAASEPTPILPASIFLNPIIWDLDSDIDRELRGSRAPPECPAGRKFVPQCLRAKVIRWAHTSASSGHPGAKRTADLITQKYWWPRLSEEVLQSVRSCSVCATTKSPRQPPAGKLMPLPIPQRPWSHIAVDFLTDLPVSEGFTVILVVVDRFSKFCKFIPFSRLPTALQVAEALLGQVFRNFGLPEDIVSDRGPQFISRVWRSFFRRLGVAVSLTSGYHPESNGQAERTNQELGRMLRSHCSRNQHDWSRFLPWAEYAQNSLKNASTGLTPFQCVLGYQPPFAPWIPDQAGVLAVDDWFRRAERVWQATHVHLRRAIRHQKIQADRHRSEAPVFQPGDRAWLSTKDLRLRLPCRKLSPRFIGPFRVIRRINEVTYTLQLPSHFRISPSFHVSLLRPVIRGPLADEVPPEEPPPALDVEGSVAYSVRSLLDSRRRQGRLEYLVDWEGYGPEERSWVPRCDVLDPDLLRDFHRARPDRPAPRPRGRPSGTRRGPSGAVPRRGGTVMPAPSSRVRSTSPEY